jgi:hypothetical protein
VVDSLLFLKPPAGANSAMKPRFTSTNIPRIFGIVVASTFLASCYSIFDPAPYNPQFDSAFVGVYPNITQFMTLSERLIPLSQVGQYVV